MKTKTRKLRTEKGLTQKALSARSYISERQIIRIENNKSNPTMTTLENIASALGVTIGELLGEEENIKKAR